MRDIGLKSRVRTYDVRDNDSGSKDRQGSAWETLDEGMG